MVSQQPETLEREVRCNTSPLSSLPHLSNSGGGRERMRKREERQIARESQAERHKGNKH